jgi:hypothetical protein
VTMRHSGLFAFAFLVQGCSSDTTAGAGPDGSSADVVVADQGAIDTGTQADVVATDTGTEATSTQDTGADGANDAGSDALGDAPVAASEGGCPASWMVAPSVDPSITVPADGGAVLLHTAASGTQNYTCTQIDAGSFTWSFVGPEAELRDCNASLVGHHFASDAGATAPEWQTIDGTYVIGKRVAPPFVPDGGAMSVPWLLLQGTSHGGTGTLSRAGYIQRLFTDGGVAPSTACDQTVAGGAQASQKVPYVADYYFFGQ